MMSVMCLLVVMVFAMIIYGNIYFPPVYFADFLFFINESFLYLIFSEAHNGSYIPFQGYFMKNDWYRSCSLYIAL